MKRGVLKRNINRFMKRFKQPVSYHKYKSSADQAGAPYRQRKRVFETSVAIDCVASERVNQDKVTPIGNAKLRKFDVCTGVDQVIQAFHPLDHDDPRKSYDADAILDTKDMVAVMGVYCRIISIEKHGTDGGGPLWFVLTCEEDLE